MQSIVSALVGLLLLPGAAISHAPSFAAQTSTTTPEAAADAGEVPLSRSAHGARFIAAVTAYNALPAQTDGTPLETASGAYANPEIVAARSRDLAEKLPFGTVIAIEPVATSSSPSCGYDLVKPQIGYRVIADTMHPSKHDQVDILLDHTQTVQVGGKQMNPGIAFGICRNMRIRVVGHVDMAKLPKTQAELVRALERSQTLALR